MKFSVQGFQQIKLCQLNLDSDDALILRWFIDFFTGKMEKRLLPSRDGSSKEFGWVSFGKILDELPILSSKTTESISRRFDYYVSIGFFEARLVRSNSGSKTFFRHNNRLYDNLVNASSPLILEEFVPAELLDSGKLFTTNRAEFIRKARSLQSTSKSVADSTSKSVADSTSKSVAQSTSKSVALNNPSSNIIQSDPSISLLEIDKAISHLSAGYVFRENFRETATKFFSDKKIEIDEICPYFHFVDVYVCNQAPKNKANLFFRIFTADSVYEAFRRDQPVPAAKKTCPVCQKTYTPNYSESCPECGFSEKHFSDQDEIIKAKNYLALPQAEREAYEKELMSEMFVPKNGQFPDIKEIRQKLNEKYKIKDA